MMYEFKDHFLTKIKAYEQSGVIDKKTSELLKNQVELTTYRFMFDYFSFSKSLKLKRKGIDMNDLVPENYYDFIKELPLYKQSILVNEEFGIFINRLEFAPPLKVNIERINVGVFTNDFLDFIESEKKTISSKDKDLLLILNKYFSKGEVLIDNLLEKQTKFFKNNKTLIENYNTVDRISELKKRNFIRKVSKEVIIADSLNINNNLVYEIIQSRKLKFILDYNKLSEDKIWYWNELKKGITSPHLIKVGDAFLKNELEKPEMYKLPTEEEGTKIFNKLIAPYKGKFVVVQFWHPWSYYKGEDLKRIKEMRNMFSNNKEVVFLNITNKSRSTLEKYNESVAKNGFTNSVRIPQDDYHYLRQLFQFNKSVFDLIVLKDGVSIYELEGSHQLEFALQYKFNIKPVK